MSNLFRKKSIERISSPEQLNDYIRVSTPSVWLVLITIAVLLAGVCVWGVFGHMDTTLTVVVEEKGGTVIAYVRQTDVEKVAPGMAVTVGDKEGNVSAISAEPVQVDETFTDYMRHVGGLQTGEWVYAVTLDVVFPEVVHETEYGGYTEARMARYGVHEGKIVIDSVSPMSFVLN